MDWISQQIASINIAQLLAIGVLMWIFYNRLNQKMEKGFERLDEKVTDIDRRLCRLEGAFSNKDCCAIKHDRIHEKIE